MGKIFQICTAKLDCHTCTSRPNPKLTGVGEPDVPPPLREKFAEFVQVSKVIDQFP